MTKDYTTSTNNIRVYKTFPDDCESVLHVACDYYNFDEIPDLTYFFDSISKEYGISYRFDIVESFEMELRNCIKRIELYRKGESKYYPDELVKECLSGLGFDAAFIFNHADGFISLVYSELFLMCCAFYSPDISYLVNMQSPDHKVGIFNFGHDYNFNSWWSYFIVKKRKGYEVICLGDYTKINSIFVITNQGDTCYLLSNNFGTNHFEQHLFMETTTDGMKELDRCLEPPINENIDFNTYYFNINNLSWYFCNWDDDMKERIAVSEEPAMKLQLKEGKYCFVLGNR